MKVNIKDLDIATQNAIKNILDSNGWDGRKVNIYKDYETVVFEHKQTGQQIKINNISKAIYQN